MSFFLGPPCTGKGTQTKRLIERFNIPYFGAGAELRKKYPIGTEIRAELDSGKIVASHIINDIFLSFVLKNPIFICDGFPRTLQQLEFIQTLNLQVPYFFIDTPLNQLIERMKKRVFCHICESTFKEHQICCFTNTIKRADDTDESFKIRYDVFQKEKICEKIPVIHIDGSRSEEEVFQDIVKFF